MNLHSRLYSRAHQHGMGATVILFTIALIVLVGVALAYGSRGNSKAFAGESAKVFSSVLLKQSAEYRDAYNRYIFDGGNAAAMTFTDTGTYALFDPAKQYGILQPAPREVLAAAAAWDYNNAIAVDLVGTPAGKESIIFLVNIKSEVCQQINRQMYGDAITAIPPASGITDATAFKTATVLAAANGRATGCTSTNDGTLVFYSTLGES